MTKMLATLLAIALVSTAGVFAAEETLTGKISDSLCGASHERMAAGVVPMLSDRDCTIECIKSGGQYEFVDEKNKVIHIANQDFADLQQHAGHTVKLTGEVKSGAITVSKIEMPAASK